LNRPCLMTEDASYGLWSLIDARSGGKVDAHPAAAAFRIPPHSPTSTIANPRFTLIDPHSLSRNHTHPRRARGHHNPSSGLLLGPSDDAQFVYAPVETETCKYKLPQLPSIASYPPSLRTFFFPSLSPALLSTSNCNLVTWADDGRLSTNYWNGLR
jgi:hypothetical protein